MSDMNDIFDIERRSFDSHWSYDALAVEVRRVRSYSRVLVVRRAGRVIAYSVVWSVVDEMHVLNFAVHPDYRRQGVGRRLMNGLFREARRMGLRRMTLEVRVSNEGASRLYEQMGFRTIAMRRRFYEDNGEDAYVMWLDEIPVPYEAGGSSPRSPEIPDEETSALNET